MRKVYVVTQGSYSDYGMVAVYATQEVAERAVAVLEANGRSDCAAVEEMWVHESVDLGKEVSFKVPRVRRSGEATVVFDGRDWRSHLQEHVAGLVIESRYFKGPWNETKPLGWVYYGTDEAAVFACARAQSMAWHGEVVLSHDARKRAAQAG